MLKTTTPTLLLHRPTCEANIRKMIAKAEKHDLQLIPHFKTHQSAVVGQWFKLAGVKAITVTSLKMAKYFAAQGFTDITIAFPVNVSEVKQLQELAAQVDLKVLVNSTATAKILTEQLHRPLKFYIEIDVGDNRSGIAAGNFVEISKVLQAAQDSTLEFIGFYTHPGHTYNAISPREVEEISGGVVKQLRAVKKHFTEAYPELKVGLGDTPSCSIAEDFEGVDSIHPGNFVYYDLVQNSIGVNTPEEIAICLAVPVVEVHPERNEVVVHSGWVHQGKDSLIDEGGNRHFGQVVKFTADKWSAPVPGARVIKLSQEHGVLKLPKEMIKQVNIGDLLGILPVHACATAVMMGEIWTTEGERLEMMPR